MYGRRARIGYTSAAVATEILPIDFYKMAPEGVTLMMATLPLGERGPEDLKRCYDMSVEAAKSLASAGADLVLLGGAPINLSRGFGALSDFTKELEARIGKPVTTSAAAQKNAFSVLGSRKVGTVHPFGPDQNRRHENYLAEFFKLEPVGSYAGGWDLKTLGALPPECALEWGRALKRAYPQIDTLQFVCPHWRVVEAIDTLEQELGVTVVTSLQAIAWEAFRATGVADPILGFGRLLREF